MKRIARKLQKILALPAIFLVYLYRYALNPVSKSLGGGCRFYPTCSTYALEALKTHGLFYGGWLTIVRLLKCAPYHPGGYDPVPPKRHTCCASTIKPEMKQEGKNSGSSSE